MSSLKAVRTCQAVEGAHSEKPIKGQLPTALPYSGTMSQCSALRTGLSVGGILLDIDRLVW